MWICWSESMEYSTQYVLSATTKWRSGEERRRRKEDDQFTKWTYYYSSSSFILSLLVVLFLLLYNSHMIWWRMINSAGWSCCWSWLIWSNWEDQRVGRRRRVGVPVEWNWQTDSIRGKEEGGLKLSQMSRELNCWIEVYKQNDCDELREGEALVLSEWGWQNRTEWNHQIRNHFHSVDCCYSAVN